MSRADDTLAVHFADEKALVWTVGRLLARQIWFEYRPGQLGPDGEQVPYTLILQNEAAKLMVAEFNRARDDGEM